MDEFEFELYLAIAEGQYINELMKKGKTEDEAKELARERTKEVRKQQKQYDRKKKGRDTSVSKTLDKSRGNRNPKAT